MGWGAAHAGRKAADRDGLRPVDTVDEIGRAGSRDPRKCLTDAFASADLAVALSFEEFAAYSRNVTNCSRFPTLQSARKMHLGIAPRAA